MGPLPVAQQIKHDQECRVKKLKTQKKERKKLGAEERGCLLWRHLGNYSLRLILNGLFSTLKIRKSTELIPPSKKAYDIFKKRLKGAIYIRL